MKGMTILAASVVLTFTPLFSDSLTLTNGNRYENILCEDMGSYVLVKLLKRIPSQTDTLTYKFPKSKIARIGRVAKTKHTGPVKQDWLFGVAHCPLLNAVKWHDSKQL